MLDLLTLLMAVTGDNSKPLLVAICLIASVVLTVVLLVTGRMANKQDDDIEDEEE
ncbi:MAG: hypothetical protein IJO70_02620 [Lachnospiraceae bacterium]|nr:hypothetical protein [Lachnospiraceae bacterium]